MDILLIPRNYVSQELYRIQCSCGPNPLNSRIAVNSSQSLSYQYSLNPDTAPAFNEAEEGIRSAIADAVMMIQIQSLDASMFGYVMRMMGSYRDVVDSIWSQFLIDGISFSYTQSPSNSLASLRREFLLEIAEAQLNQIERTRQRDLGKNVLSIPGTRLKMMEVVTNGRKRVINIKVAEIGGINGVAVFDGIRRRDSHFHELSGLCEPVGYLQQVMEVKGNNG